MSRHRVVATIVVAAALAVPAAAFGATSQQIYADAADGHLNGRYSQTDLRRALHDATVQGYGNQITKITVTNTINNQSQATSNASSSASSCCQSRPVFTPPLTRRSQTTVVQRSSALPFTGSNLATFASVGIILLAGGLLLRLMARRRHGL
jgi:hypothetical protein